MMGSPANGVSSAVGGVEFASTVVGEASEAILVTLSPTSPRIIGVAVGSLKNSFHATASLAGRSRIAFLNTVLAALASFILKPCSTRRCSPAFAPLGSGNINDDTMWRTPYLLFGDVC